MGMDPNRLFILTQKGDIGSDSSDKSIHTEDKIANGASVIPNREFISPSVEINCEKQLNVDDDNMESDCDSVRGKGIEKQILELDCFDMVLEGSKYREKLVNCSTVDPNVVLEFNSIEDNRREDKELNLKAVEFSVGLPDVQNVNGLENQEDFDIVVDDLMDADGVRIPQEANIISNFTGIKDVQADSMDEVQPFLCPTSKVYSNGKSNFLNLDWNGKNKEIEKINSENKNFPVNSLNSKTQKSFAETVNTSSSSINANIKIIPKLNGTKIGEVEMPYSNLMLGSVPYHSTLYGFLLKNLQVLIRFVTLFL
ncbi:hypothetical protein L2E82_23115 [Cichorium intybus]|uniref:Uncharacterized protein n=1 Tax=Cichorium intybus TaxID=13427 RepID=A0ACB9DZX6_CICIN|nr:hypothetical protein L2E82_23115 [Cichorium intybus]